MQQMTTKRRPSILSRAVDSNGNIDEQFLARFKALFSHYGVTWGAKDAERQLLVALMWERYKTAFDIKPRLPDKRCQVSNVAALKLLVTAVMAGKERQLTDPGLRDLGANVRAWLDYRGLKATGMKVCTAISKVDKGKWRGVKPATLRDNALRPPGSRRKRTSAGSLLEALKRFRDWLVEAEKTAPDVEPGEE